MYSSPQGSLIKCSNEKQEHLMSTTVNTMSGYDTTSTVSEQGKMKFFKVLEKSTLLPEAAKCFQEPDAFQDALAVAG